MTVQVRHPSGSHRRQSPLTGEWVLVAAGRDKRPWRGQIEPTAVDNPPTYDPDCFLCPGNVRTGGARNPNYESTFVFTNDHASLRPDPPADPGRIDDPLFAVEPVRGTCRVLCFSGRHDLSLAQMSVSRIREVVDLWCAQYEGLSKEWDWVQIFENRGAAMGASSPHPHGQLWAGSAIPTLVQREQQHQGQYFATMGRPLLTEYAEREVRLGTRMVMCDDDWLLVVPYWATWPFETLLVSRRGTARFDELTGSERMSLAGVLQAALRAYDSLFGVPFPYSMGWHPAPGSDAAEHWVLHAHVYPPLLRADARKFMVGYELLAEAQRDLTPEEAAEQLRAAVRSS